jgi:hypothetical protein
MDARIDARIARLKAFVAAQGAAGKIQAVVAADLGIAQGHLSRVLNERDDVTRDIAFAIERVTKDWVEGQILATEWAEYKPRLGRGGRRDAAPTTEQEQSSAESGEHTTTAEPERAAPASEPPSAAGNGA